MADKSWEFDFIDLDAKPKESNTQGKGKKKPSGLELLESKAVTIELSGRELVKAMKHEKAKAILKNLPLPGQSIHIIQNGNFDFFNYLPILVEMMDGADEAYLTTWTMNRENVTDLFEIYDQDRIRKVSMITGVYFKTRETAVYSMLMEYIQARKQRYLTCRMHAKIMLLANHSRGIYICLEGSANFTANPRIEQAMVTNSLELYNFHREWMEELHAQNNQG